MCLCHYNNFLKLPSNFATNPLGDVFSLQDHHYLASFSSILISLGPKLLDALTHFFLCIWCILLFKKCKLIFLIFPSLSFGFLSLELRLMSFCNLFRFSFFHQFSENTLLPSIPPFSDFIALLYPWVFYVSSSLIFSVPVLLLSSTSTFFVYFPLSPSFCHNNMFIVSFSKFWRLRNCRLPPSCSVDTAWRQGLTSFVRCVKYLSFRKFQ
jgi:hypothetical protein